MNLKNISTEDLGIKLEKIEGLIDHYFRMKEEASCIRDWRKVDELFKNIAKVCASKEAVVTELKQREPQ